MTLFRTVLLTSGLVLVACDATAQAQAPAAGKMVTLQMPALPDPVRVTLKPATTALVVFDVVEPICKSQPKCMSQILPALAPFMAQARKAGVAVAYGTRAPNVTKWMPDIAPKPGDIQVVSTAQDRFFNTDLDKMLKAKGIHAGSENFGAPVVTRSGLVLIAATRDEKIRAFDKKTGELLWEADLPAAGIATPAVYEVNGKEYVVIACGGGGKQRTRSSDQYFAFALPDAPGAAKGIH